MTNGLETIPFFRDKDLNRDLELKAEYKNTIQEYVNLGHLTPSRDS